MPPSKAQQDYKAMEEVEDDRMTMHMAMTCHNRCINYYMTNMAIGPEKTCMENCLWKLFQVSTISTINYQQFTQFVAKGGKAY